jgi:hypothetical protein
MGLARSGTFCPSTRPTVREATMAKGKDSKKEVKKPKKDAAKKKVK